MRLVEAKPEKFYSVRSSMVDDLDENQLDKIDISKEFTKHNLAPFYSLKPQQSPAVIHKELNAKNIASNSDEQPSVTKTEAAVSPPETPVSQLSPLETPVPPELPMLNNAVAPETKLSSTEELIPKQLASL